MNKKVSDIDVSELPPVDGPEEPEITSFYGPEDETEAMKTKVKKQDEPKNDQ